MIEWLDDRLPDLFWELRVWEWDDLAATAEPWTFAAFVFAAAVVVLLWWAKRRECLRC